MANTPDHIEVAVLGGAADDLVNKVTGVWASALHELADAMTGTKLGDRDFGYLEHSPIDAIVAERQYQVEKYGPVESSEHTWADMALVLMAEVGEAASALKALSWPKKSAFDGSTYEPFDEARTELIQVAAVAVAIVDMIDHIQGWPTAREDQEPSPETSHDRTDPRIAIPSGSLELRIPSGQSTHRAVIERWLQHIAETGIKVTGFIPYLHSPSDVVYADQRVMVEKSLVDEARLNASMPGDVPTGEAEATRIIVHVLHRLFFRDDD